MTVSTIGATDSSVPLLLGALCLVILLVSLLRRWQQRSATGRDLTRAQLARLREQREVQQSMEELLGQLEEVTNRINAQLDARFARLEALLGAADERIGRPSVTASAVQEAAPVVKEQSEAAPAVERDAAERCDAWPARRKRILELADAGTTSAGIADVLHIPIGEVELVLNLRSYERRCSKPAESTLVA